MKSNHRRWTRIFFSLASIEGIPNNQQAAATESSTPSSAQLLAAAVPLKETPAAASRLDTIIHQSNTDPIGDSSSSYYNVSQGHQYDRVPKSDSVYMQPEHAVSSIHGETQDTVAKSVESLDTQRKRSTSSVSGSSSSASVGAGHFERSSAARTSAGLRNSNMHRSLGTIPVDSQGVEQGLSPSNKAASLDFRPRSNPPDESGWFHLRRMCSIQTLSLSSDLCNTDRSSPCCLRLREYNERMAAETESQ